MEVYKCACRARRRLTLMLTGGGWVNANEDTVGRESHPLVDFYQRRGSRDGRIQYPNVAESSN